MSNKHSRLKQLEKLAAISKLNAKNLAARTEQDKLSKEFAALSDSDLLARYQAELEQPIDPAILTLTTQELIEKYTQLCQEK